MAHPLFPSLSLNPIVGYPNHEQRDSFALHQLTFCKLNCPDLESSVTLSRDVPNIFKRVKYNVWLGLCEICDGWLSRTSHVYFSDLHNQQNR